MAARPARDRSPASPSRRERIIALGEDGLTPAAIAAALGVHPMRATCVLNETGLRRPRASRSPHRATACGRKGYTRAEDGFITRLRVSELSTSEIARRVTLRFGHPRTRRAIASRLYLLAAAEAFAEAR